MFVDYFYYPLNRTASSQPWKHYIPVRCDLSDLVEKTLYVMDPTNYEHVQQVIENSNGWCYERMINTLILEDMIDMGIVCTGIRND